MSTTQQQHKQQPKPDTSGFSAVVKSRYGAMRTWSSFLYAIGVLGAITAAIGAIVLAVQLHNFWQALGVLLIVGPVSIFLATFPVALSQSMNALADVAEAVTGPDLPGTGGPGF